MVGNADAIIPFPERQERRLLLVLDGEILQGREVPLERRQRVGAARADDELILQLVDQRDLVRVPRRARPTP
jgi:hypothetical protein